MDESPSARHYFVDEAGCLTLFNKHGKCIVGTEGVSRVFMVGVAHVSDIENATRRLESLRAALLADPYFRGVPSMQPERRKTALQFHAKDDPPEVRREVFRLLPTLGVKVQVIVRRKSNMAITAKRRFELKGTKLGANEVYDDLVKRLFRNLLHKEPCRILFARRGKSARFDALQQAIEQARRNFARKWGISSDLPVTIESGYPTSSAGIQIVDYYLWALQRLYERGEDRFFALLANDFRLIIDLDDQSDRRHGTYYSDQNPFTLQKIKPVEG